MKRGFSSNDPRLSLLYPVRDGLSAGHRGTLQKGHGEMGDGVLSDSLEQVRVRSKKSSKSLGSDSQLRVSWL